VSTSHLAAEIATQAADWRAILARVPEARAALPAEGARVAVTGCGTSFFMAQAYAALREAAGHGYTDAHASSEFPLDRHYAHVVAISRSGTTTEVVELLETLRARGRATTAIVATADTPIPALARHRLMMGEVDEQSVVQTRFATTTLALLRATLGEDLTGAIADAEAVLAED
jgi:fructoselysine-6-P-deglycase FrlB-like protein